MGFRWVRPEPQRLLRLGAGRLDGNLEPLGSDAQGLSEQEQGGPTRGTFPDSEVVEGADGDTSLGGDLRKGPVG